ncbi:MAG: diaminopimelate epimerase [Actinomycetota bacterium]
MEISKYQGLGNDFLIVFNQTIDSGIARRLCHRNFGVGADGVIVVGPSDVADFSFLLYNSDGSTAEISGNGLRCVALYLHEKGLHAGDLLKIEVAGEVRPLELVREGDKLTGVRADMGVPRMEGEVSLHGLQWVRVNMGNPHAVTFLDDIATAPLTEIGPLVETHPLFPDRTNVEFVQQEGETLNVRFWERGVGVTLASGSGSCAAVAASGLDRAVVRTAGGDLTVEKDSAGRLWMTGPAVHVFDAATFQI